MAAVTRLDLLACGTSGVVVRVEGDPTVAKRLSDLGFWPDTVVVAGRRSVFGDPVEYRLRGYRVALRRTEAEHVLVSELAAPA